VDWCNPYVDSCTSISATGRRPPASFVFRGVMLPSAMLMMLYWWLHWFWLGTVSTHARPRHTMLGLGWLACLGLVLYVTVLGEVGDVWRLQRKIGTVLFFSFTFLSQLLLAGMLRDLPELDLNAKARASAVGGRLLRLCQIMLTDRAVQCAGAVAQRGLARSHRGRDRVAAGTAVAAELPVQRRALAPQRLASGVSTRRHVD
jgi:hypothetical protein